MSAVSFLLFLVLCHLAHSESAEDDNSLCPKSFDCGKLGNLSFPFTDRPIDKCGFFIVQGCDQPVQTIQLKSGERFYEVETISQSQSHTYTIIINDTLLLKHLGDNSCQYFEDLDLHLEPFKHFHYGRNLSVFKCSSFYATVPQQLLSIECSASNEDAFYYNRQDNDSSSFAPFNCSVIQIPINYRHFEGIVLFSLLPASFSLEVKIDETCVQCHNKGGVCLSDSDSHGSFGCHFSKPEVVAGKREVALRLGLGIIYAVTVLMIMILALIKSRKYWQSKCLMFWTRKAENFKNIEVFLDNFGSSCPQRYSYSDIKKITKSFKHKIGQGGFGGVYKGKLQDGRLVAVKVLTGSKGNGEDFINEVSSISRTSHINVVTLLGFCFQGRKRALVYDFMPNGSLEKFIYEKIPTTSDRTLKWETLREIAVGIARGLEYLHRGCNTRILHFDIKPHNILLDAEFCPKICDFGLAKICPRKESVVSMLGARGTPGYIAPEVFSRNFGGVSHKSDVYSYGMMVLEMVGGRRNIECEADRTSEFYFPHWIYKRIEVGEELGLRGVSGDEEKEEARKMIIVSMWCIQTDPSNRPPMSRVVEMLEGRLHSLEIPPQPFLSSPSRSPVAESSIIMSSVS